MTASPDDPYARRLTRFEDYAGKYEHIRLERRANGVLEMTLHTNGGSLVWGAPPRDDLMGAFRNIAEDPDIRVVILTGTGEEFNGPRASEEARHYPEGLKPWQWDIAYSRGKRLQMNLLDIEVPIIAAVNGPSKRHCEIPLLCDIVLAAEHASFEDTAHFHLGNMVPGDGVHVAFPMLMGINRARYMMLTGQVLTAQKAMDYGLVGEVLPRDALLPRARELADQLAAKPVLQLRYTRAILTQYLKKQMLDLVGYGLALEGLAEMGRGPART